MPAPMKDSTRRMARRLMAPVCSSAVYGLSLFARSPKALRATPPDLWPGNPERGRSILRGRFDLGTGRTVVSVDPWSSEDGSEAFKATLNGFTWLRDAVMAEDAATVQSRLRTLLGDWLVRNARWSPIAWRADVVGERVVAWLIHYDRVVASAGEPFRRQVLRSLARQLVHLGRVAEWETDGAARLTALKGLVYGGICLPEGDGRLRSALHRLEREIERQIMPDGGHLERSPSTHHRILRDLIDLRATLRAANHDTPPYLQNAIDRMAPMLRFFRHADGGLAHFNGSRTEDPACIDLTLAKADAKGQPPRSAPYVGFERLAAGRQLLIVDAGPPPEPGLDHTAHAGTLSFEFSIGRDRLIVNCGATAADVGPWKQAQRATAAHSTLSVADTNSSELKADGTIGRRPRSVTCERQDAETEGSVRLSHDGYGRTFGIVHHRQLRLVPATESLAGEDRLAGPADKAFAIRFHLHPTVSASIVKSGTAALLRLARGGWRISAAGASLRLDESIYIGANGGPRRSQQVVLEGVTTAAETVIAWTIAPER